MYCNGVENMGVHGITKRLGKQSISVTLKSQNGGEKMVAQYRTMGTETILRVENKNSTKQSNRSNIRIHILASHHSKVCYMKTIILILLWDNHCLGTIVRPVGINCSWPTSAFGCPKGNHVLDTTL